MTLLAVGSVAFDSVKTPFGQVERVVGGSATYFSLSASYFTDVSIVAVVGDDFTAEYFDLFKQKGIDVRQIQRMAGKSFFWRGEYNENLNEATTLSTELNVFADFRPEVHPEYRQTPYLFLGNIDPDLQNHVLDQVQSPRLVGLDTMNFWIQSKPESLAQVLSRVDVLLINEGEARMLSGEYHMVRAARKVAAMGPRILVIKRGEYGAMVYMDDEFFLTPAFPLDELADPTGAGDCFAGGFMGYLAGCGRVDRDDVRQAVLYGTIMASFDVEKFSIERISRLTFPEIRDRFDRFHTMTQVTVP